MNYTKVAKLIKELAEEIQCCNAFELLDILSGEALSEEDASKIEFEMVD